MVTLYALYDLHLLQRMYNTEHVVFNVTYYIMKGVRCNWIIYSGGYIKSKILFTDSPIWQIIVIVALLWNRTIVLSNWKCIIYWRHKRYKMKAKHFYFDSPRVNKIVTIFTLFYSHKTYSHVDSKLTFIFVRFSSLQFICLTSARL